MKGVWCHNQPGVVALHCRSIRPAYANSLSFWARVPVQLRSHKSSSLLISCGSDLLHWPSRSQDLISVEKVLTKWHWLWVLVISSTRLPVLPTVGTVCHVWAVLDYTDHKVYIFYSCVRFQGLGDGINHMSSLSLPLHHGIKLRNKSGLN